MIGIAATHRLADHFFFLPRSGTTVVMGADTAPGDSG